MVYTEIVKKISTIFNQGGFDMKKNIIAITCALALLATGSVSFANSDVKLSSNVTNINSQSTMTSQNYKDFYELSSEIVSKIKNLKTKGYTLEKQKYLDFINKCDEYVDKNSDLDSVNILNELNSELKGRLFFGLPTNDAIDFSAINYVPSISVPDKNLEKAILKEIFKNDSYDSKTDGALHYYYQKIDLNGDSKDEVLAYVYGTMVSGTGGDSLYIFEENEGNYTIKTSISTVRKPILISNIKTNDWNDMVIPVYGGGIKGFYSDIKYDNDNYPTSPSVEDELNDRFPIGQATAVFPELWEIDKGIEIK